MFYLYSLGISINLLFGENGVITMAQKAKKEYETASKNEEQLLSGALGKSFEDYNGKLTLDGVNIVNKYGEKIQLKGLVRHTIKSWFCSL